MDNKQNDKRLRNIWGSIFIFGLLCTIMLFDSILTKNDPVGKSTLFKKNDYEKIKLSNPNEIYDKVFYGNSVVISAFKEKESESGYINMGMDYATIKDLSKILKNDMIQIGTDLVIGVNYLTFLDTFDTNPTYPWHRKVYEPYLYFQRDKLHDFINSNLEMIIKERELELVRYNNFNRYVYHGILSDEEMDEKIEVYKSLYWNEGIESYQENLKELQEIINYCNERDIRIRVIYMPWNDYIAKPLNVVLVEDEVKQILHSNNIQYIDLAGIYSKECFHDLGHLNYEFGAVKFTREIDKWLIQD